MFHLEAVGRCYLQIFSEHGRQRVLFDLGLALAALGAVGQ